jgi:regulator of sigma E protease
VLNPLILVLAIVGLGFLIVVHEAGHYVVARWCRMAVDRFSIGFGPGLLKKRTRSGTVFQLAPIPFGGFVEIRGMNIAEEIGPEDQGAFPNRPVWQRFATIFAGPATNYLAALVLALGLYTCHGHDVPEWYGVRAVIAGYDAKDKLHAGDRVLAVDGVPLRYTGPSGLSKRVNASQGAPMTFQILREGVVKSVTIKPRLAFETTPITERNLDQLTRHDPALAPFAEMIRKMLPEQVWRIGVQWEVHERTYEVGVLEATELALRYPIEQTKMIGRSLYEIVWGGEDADPGGPIRIVEEIYKAFKIGLVYGVKLIMMLSVYLGLFNLLPLPALDGGRLVFLVYEMVTRRRANPKVEMIVHMVGIMALMVLMVLVTYKDIRRVLPF